MRAGGAAPSFPLFVHSVMHRAEHGLCPASTAREKPARILPCLANQSALRQPIGAGDFESLVRKPMPPGQHIRPERRCCFRDRHAEHAEYAEAPLIGIQDYSVFENKRIGWIRFADEHMPGVWLWNVVVHLTSGLPMGSASDLDTAGPAGESVQRRFLLSYMA
jgi:hypothetical protein